MAPTICDIILNDETEPLSVVLQEPVNLPVLKKLLFHPMLTQEQRWSLQSYDSIVHASITYIHLHYMGLDDFMQRTDFRCNSSRRTFAHATETN